MILKQLKHPNIVEYEDAFQVEPELFRMEVTFTLLLSTAMVEI